MKTTSKTKPNKTKARFRSPFTPSEQETHQAYSTASAASMGHHFCQALLLLLLVCVSFTIIGQPRNSVLIRRV